MSTPVVLRGAAYAELLDAHDWYERRQPGLGLRFEQAVQDRLDELAAYPDRYPVVYRDIREVRVNGFPFCLYYVVEPTRILVHSVFHIRRNPAVWKRRR